MNQQTNDEIPTINIIRLVFQWMKDRNIKEVCFKESATKNTLSFETKEDSPDIQDKSKNTFALTKGSTNAENPKIPNSYVIENAIEKEITTAYELPEDQEILTELDLARLINDIE